MAAAEASRNGMRILFHRSLLDHAETARLHVAVRIEKLRIRITSDCSYRPQAHQSTSRRSYIEKTLFLLHLFVPFAGLQQASRRRATLSHMICVSLTFQLVAIERRGYPENGAWRRRQDSPERSDHPGILYSPAACSPTGLCRPPSHILPNMWDGVGIGWEGQRVSGLTG